MTYSFLTRIAETDIFRFLFQRLAEDSNPAIAAAASKAIYELKKQWKIEEGDSWRFMMNKLTVEKDSQEVEDDADKN